MQETNSLSNIPKQLCVYFSDFLGIKEIGRMTRVNKHWKEALERDYVWQKIAEREGIDGLFEQYKKDCKNWKEFIKNVFFAFDEKYLDKFPAIKKCTSYPNRQTMKRTTILRGTSKLMMGLSKGIHNWRVEINSKDASCITIGVCNENHDSSFYSTDGPNAVSLAGNGWDGTEMQDLAFGNNSTIDIKLDFEKNMIYFGEVLNNGNHVKALYQLSISKLSLPIYPCATIYYDNTELKFFGYKKLK